MSKTTLGNLQSRQESLLNVREGFCQMTLWAHAEESYSLELPGHHVGARASGRLIVSARQQCVARRQVHRHQSVDELDQTQTLGGM
jgi:hypothetical protein